MEIFSPGLGKKTLVLSGFTSGQCLPKVLKILTFKIALQALRQRRHHEQRGDDHVS